MKKQLEYPIDSFILWCGEYYKVISNTGDYKGIVKDVSGDNQRFYFEFENEKAELITDKEKIKDLVKLFSKSK